MVMTLWEPFCLLRHKQYYNIVVHVSQFGSCKAGGTAVGYVRSRTENNSLY